MKLMLILAVALVILAGGGGAVWYFFIQDSEQRGEAAEPVIQPTFLDLAALNVPVIREGKIERYILLKITLDLSDEKAKRRAQSLVPKLRDSYLKDLYDYFANVAPAGDDRVNLRAVKARLERIGTTVLGEGQLNAVLVQGVFERDWKRTD